MALDSVTETPTPTDNGEDICSEPTDSTAPQLSVTPKSHLTGDARIERAWAHWKKLGEPKLIVAPMVDNSELPFRLLCRKYGATAAYTPMLHSRLFTESEKYRAQEFTTCNVSRLCTLAYFSLLVINM